MTNTSQLEQAVYNNAIWCNTVCAAHGIPIEFLSHIWLARKPTPRFYPNAVTLSDEVGLAEQMTAIQSLIADPTLTNIGVKDSFNVLNLTGLGFTPMFEASWIWRDPAQPISRVADRSTRWEIIREPHDLSQWEIAWGNPEKSVERRIFLPSLLTDRNVIFIAAHRDTRIVGGAIGNLTGDVVGLSNLFTTDDEVACWAGSLAVITDTFPGRAIVGYEHGANLEFARTFGFKEIGTLRVWGRD